MSRPSVEDLSAVEEMGGCVLPTEAGMRAAFEWLAEREGVRRDWYAEEVPTILAGIDAARRLLAAHREPETVTTVAEVEALPDLSIVHDGDALVAQRVIADCDGWAVVGDTAIAITSADLIRDADGPLTVLYRGGDR